MTTLPFSCQCGTVRGSVSGVTPHSSNRVLCFCSSCRAGALYCGAEDPLRTGVDLVQVMSDQIDILSAPDQLVPFSFGRRNLLRWKARCCGVQMFSTPRNPKMPLVGLSTARIEDATALGPVKSRAFVPKGNGKTAHENLRPLIRVALRMIVARFTGRWQDSPLFDPDTLAPIAPVTLVSRQQRHALLSART